MEPFFEQQSKKAKEVGFPDYFLAENPFPAEGDLIEGEGEGEDVDSLYCNQIYAKEIRRIFDSIFEASEKGKKKVWLVKDEKVVQEDNISVVTGLFRALTISESPRVFSSYIPFPVIVPDPLAGILRWCADRLSVERFRYCVYTFVYRELKNLLESGTASEVFTQLDVSDVLQQMNDTKGEAIDEILFIEEPEEEEAQDAGAGDQPEEKTGAADAETAEGDHVPSVEEVSSEEEAKRKDELEEKKRTRNELVRFLQQRIAASGFSPQIRGALALAITEGFERGHSNIGLGEYRETLKGLFSLVSIFFAKAVIIVDRLDNWDMLTETQQAQILGALSELNWLIGKSGITVLCAYNRTVKAFDEDFVSSYQKLALDLWPAALDLRTPITPEKASDLISYFIQFDEHRKEKLVETASKGLSSIHPFTEEGIGELVEKVNGDIVKLLVGAGKLLETGKAENQAVLDKEFVKNQAFEED